MEIINKNIWYLIYTLQVNLMSWPTLPLCSLSLLIPFILKDLNLKQIALFSIYYWQHNEIPTPGSYHRSQNKRKLLGTASGQTMEQRFPLRRTNTPRARTDWLSCPLLWSSAPPSQNGKNNIIISSSQSQATLKTLKTSEGFIYQTSWSDTSDKIDTVGS